MIEVLCIGHAAYDMILPLDAFPAENSKAEIAKSLESGGGPAANAAYLLSSWGIACAFAGVIGDDHYGQQITAEFKKVGTDMRLLDRSSDAPTPLSVILVNRATGSRTIVNRKTDRTSLQLGDTGPDFQPRVLLFDGHEPNASLEALERFGNATTILDAGSLRNGTEALTPRVEYLVASERFALQVTGLDDLASEDRQARGLMLLEEQCHGTVVITLGEQGLVYRGPNGLQRMDAYPVKAADTTAAGDIFHGAFAYGMVKAMSLEQTLRLATVAAGLSVRQPGGRRSIPQLADVEEALQDD